MAKNIAQPNNRPVRNLTSFSASLRCMDNLLANAKRPRILISSTGINDRSRKTFVGADEMLLNAINHMNIKSRAYVFLDQSFSKDFGQLVLLSPTEEQQKPGLYFRGSITQVDTNTVNDRANLDLDFTNAPHPLTINGGALEKASSSFSKGVSIVSVDLHLVSYPDKTVLPGGSVANSMVVTNKAFGTGASGLIKLTGYDISLSFNRVESIGQAVRNLIELGTIELLGQHAKVPYWQCLNIEQTNERLENKKRMGFTVTPNSISISETQKMLFRLGYFSGQATGRMNLEMHKALAKFQADKDLIATGDLNYDVYSRLVQELNRRPDSRVTQTPAGRHLMLASTKNGNRVNGKFVVKLKSNSSGYLYCFHQSGGGDVVQILPQKPNTKLQVAQGYSRSLPDRNDGFMLKFERENKAERIMCVLQNLTAGAVSPFAGQFETFAALPVDRLEDIPQKFVKFGGLKDQAMITRTAH
ncbi:MAG: DUF4384 domain-containing protein [Proteobacteria bacterium]|nr:DUF4384 domain-containing protein [Pseudomonadota bacterium]